jgi:hypothetical protein
MGLGQRLKGNNRTPTASKSGNKLKQYLPAMGLLQRHIGTILKVWIQQEIALLENYFSRNKQLGEYRETIVNFRISGHLYFACSKLDQLFATGRLVLTVASYPATCKTSNTLPYAPCTGRSL